LQAEPGLFWIYDIEDEKRINDEEAMKILRISGSA